MIHNGLVRLCPVLLALCLAFVFAGDTLARNPASHETIAKRLNASLNPVDVRLDEIELLLAEETPGEALLTELRTELEATDERVLQKVVALQPEISSLDTALSSLPPPPGDVGPPEAAEISAERDRLTNLKAQVTLAMRDAELLAVRSRDLLERVLQARRSMFINTLTSKRSFDLNVFQTVWNEGPANLSAVWSTISVWIAGLFTFHIWRTLAVLILAGLVSCMLHMLLRPLRRWLTRVQHDDNPDYLQRVTLAFFSIVLPGAAVAVLAATLHQLLAYFGLYRLHINLLFPAFLTVLVGYAFVWLLLRAVLAPGDENRRLLNLSDGAARRLMSLGQLMAIIHGLDYFASRAIEIFAMPVEFSVAKSMLATLLIAVTLIAVVTTRLRPSDPEGPRIGYRGWHPALYWLIWISIVAIVLAEVSGYISLGRFIASQIIITGSVFATMYIGFLSARAISTQGAMATTALGARLQTRRQLSDLRLDQVGLLISVVINGLVLLIGIPFLLLQWGFQPDDLYGWVRAAVFGFTVGDVEISFGRILVALAVFMLLIGVTRIIQRWFDGKVLARTQLDAGVKNSVKAGVGYVGFFIAALIAISWAGLNLSNIALIAGALSVGIGFGLQNIVNNFVSGIIMLIERPIKVGDIIAIGGSEGFVRKINVRATELETFDRQSVIIPNSEVINTSVGNWMHTDSVRRIVIGVGVAYGSDIHKVRELLLQTIEGDDRVASYPPPFVYFANFGNSSLDFQLRFFIRNIMETPVVETDVRFAIDKAFRENDIEIPFPQTDLHIRSGLPDLNDSK